MIGSGTLAAAGPPGRTHRILAIAAGLLFATLAVSAARAQSAAESPARATRDPFALPGRAAAGIGALRGQAYATAVPSAAATSATTAAGMPSTSAAPVQPTPPTPWAPRLRGVMVDGRRSLANVEGVLLALGQSVDGHRLVAVREGEAEFIHEGHAEILRMPDHEETRTR